MTFAVCAIVYDASSRSRRSKKICRESANKMPVRCGVIVYKCKVIIIGGAALSF